MRVVVITGVSSGIGLAQAKIFLNNGDRVIGLDKHPVQEEICKNFPENFTFILMDCAKEEAVRKLPEVCDILLNTAGILDDFKSTMETDYEWFHHVLQNNVTSMFLMVKKFLPKMIEKKSGIIINMASIAGMVAGGGGLSYTTSKHAVTGLTKQLALDVARNGVFVCGIAPGAVKTAMNAKDFEGDGEIAKWVAEKTPVGRWSTPEEIAELTFFLASGKANYMQGSILTIDGGWLLT